jgi:hypothetical protein
MNRRQAGTQMNTCIAHQHDASLIQSLKKIDAISVVVSDTACTAKHTVSYPA